MQAIDDPNALGMNDTLKKPLNKENVEASSNLGSKLYPRLLK